MLVVVMWPSSAFIFTFHNTILLFTCVCMCVCVYICHIQIYGYLNRYMNMFICIFICVYMFIWVCAYSTCFILFYFNHTFYFSVYFWFTVTLYFQARLVCLYRSFILGTLYVCTCFPMPFLRWLYCYCGATSKVARSP